ncbi:MAG: hypothetical protein F9K18_07840 [Thermoanaerobaculia bacterium]|nr:MAG: hypothetical protein F9K18_07840 [Thermoanaerobaculia bacterium]
MRRLLSSLVLVAVLATVALVAAEPAGAIPAFARRYGLSCSTCHAPFPRLTAYGDDFAARGFRMPDPDAEPAEATRETGDPKLQLPANLPLAVRIEAHGAWREKSGAEADFESPWLFKLLSGGPIAPKISYYAYFIVEQGEVTGLEDAYLHFQRVFGSGVDVLFGQFQVCDPLFKRELRLERSDYEIYRVRVGAARANLTYDRGVMLFGTLPGDVDTVLQIVNGNGIPKGTFDNDSNKNLALRLAREFGPVKVGAFGYWGEEEDATGLLSDRIVYFGPDVVISPGGRWELNLQYLERRDDDPFFLGASARELETRGGFAELHLFPQGKQGDWTVSALYNRVDSDDPLALRDDASLTLGYLAARNVRVLAEVGRDFELDEARASLGVVAAF